MGESNGKLPLRTWPGCSVPEPYRSPDWALVPAKPAQGLNTHYYYYIYIYITRLAWNEIFLPSNKIYQEIGRAKELSAPRYESARILFRLPHNTSTVHSHPICMNYRQISGPITTAGVQQLTKCIVLCLIHLLIIYTVDIRHNSILNFSESILC
jgi:hypothetical protein